MSALTIGQAAKRAGVGVETLRYYEREGLIAEPPRRASGYRQYPPGIVRRVRFIRRAKDLGFSLREIKELLAVRLDDSGRQLDVREATRIKIGEIDAKISQLSAIRDALVRLAEACPGTTGDCPILDAMDPEAPASTSAAARSPGPSTKRIAP